MKHSAKRKKEFSKIITVVGLTMWGVVNIYALVMMAVILDLTPLALVLGSVDAVVAIICGHYFWKAKAENIIKLKKAYGEYADGIEDIKVAQSDRYDQFE